MDGIGGNLQVLGGAQYFSNELTPGVNILFFRVKRGEPLG